MFSEEREGVDIVATILDVTERKRADEELKGKTGRHLLLEVKGYPEPDPTLLVQNSLPELIAQADVFAAEFYRRLFAKSEEVRMLFHREMGAQGRMLVEMLEGQTPVDQSIG